MYDKYIEKIDRLNEQGRRLALQMLDDLLSNKKNRKDYESPRQRFIRETDEILAVVNRESGATVNDKKVLPLFKKKVPAIWVTGQRHTIINVRYAVNGICWPEEYTGGGNTDRRFYLSEMQTGETTDNATNRTAQNGANVNRRIDTKKIVVQPNHYFFKYYMWYKDTHISIISYIEKIGNSKKQKNLDFSRFYNLFK